jgi:hypothetical protein
MEAVKITAHEIDLRFDDTDVLLFKKGWRLEGTMWEDEEGSSLIVKIVPPERPFRMFSINLL